MKESENRHWMPADRPVSPSMLGRELPNYNHHKLNIDKYDNYL